MTDFASAIAEIWPEADALGMLATATDDDGSFKVDFRRPGEVRNGQITNEYEIEYQSADRPDLKADDALTLSNTPFASDAGAYRVRQPPYVAAPGNAADGFYTCAVLTKV